MQDFYAELDVLGRKVELFVNSFVPRGDGIVKSLVTTVTLRVPLNRESPYDGHVVVSGSAILNPKDQFDALKGVREAYKRAWVAYDDRVDAGFGSMEWDQLRLARWRAMEGKQMCSQFTPEDLLPKSSLEIISNGRRAALIAKYPHDAVEEKPDFGPMPGQFRARNVGVMFSDNSEGYAWWSSTEDGSLWWVFPTGVIPTGGAQPNPTINEVEAGKTVIRWRDITNWAKERADYAHQPA